MTNQPLETHIRYRNSVAIIDLRGEINAQAESSLRAAYERVESASAATILLNFTQVSYINSSGVALIISLIAMARRAKRRLAAYGLSPHYVEIFHITRLADLMSIIENEASLQAAQPSEW